MRTALFVVGRDDPDAKPGGEDRPVRDDFGALVERQSRLLFRIALAVLRNKQDAEDVVQDVFLEVYRGDRWKQMEDERSYLAQATWRQAVRQHKRSEREVELATDRSSWMPGPEQNAPEQNAMDRQLERWLHQQIDALPGKLRQPMVLVAVGELKLVEIARMLDLPEGTVRRRIHDARATLKEKLRERKGGSSESDEGL
jgi:RNA polymerase sigma-70 factor (ECF subfamily)